MACVRVTFSEKKTKPNNKAKMPAADRAETVTRKQGCIQFDIIFQATRKRTGAAEQSSPCRRVLLSQQDLHLEFLFLSPLSLAF